MTIICKMCGKPFTLTPEVLALFETWRVDLPARCDPCVRARAAARAAKKARKGVGLLVEAEKAHCYSD